jgi:hypothetical protein
MGRNAVTRCLALASGAGGFRYRTEEARTCPRELLRRVSIASLKIGQDLFDQPTVANVYAEAKWARPGVGPVALSATATDNNFGVLVGRALTWLS